MIGSILIVSLIFLILYFYKSFKSRTKFFEQRKVLCNQWEFPGGNTNGVGKKIRFTHALKKVYDDYKDRDVICGFYMMYSPIYIPTDLDLIKDILIKDFDSFVNRGVYYNERDDPLSAHLFSLEGEKWKFMRQKLTATFTSGKMKMMFHTIADKGDDFIKVLDNSTFVEIKKVVARYTIDIIGSCAFGLECGTLKNENSEFFEMAHKVFDFRGLRLLYLYFIESFQGLSRMLRLRYFREELESYFFNILETTITQRKSNNVKRNDFLQLLLELHENESDSRNLTFNEIAAQAFLFLFAGYDNTALTISFMLYELSVNQEIQNKARDEVQIITEKHDGNITYEALQEMSYLSQIVNETLRKYPLQSFLMRIATKNYHIKNTKHVIEKGSRLYIPVHAIHHDSKYYENPEIFDPDRFTPEATANRHNMAYLPFGDGQRNCIGMKFAILVTKFLLAKVLSTHKFNLHPKTNLPIKVTQQISRLDDRHGIYLNFERI